MTTMFFIARATDTALEYLASVDGNVFAVNSWRDADKFDDEQSAVSSALYAQAAANGDYVEVCQEVVLPAATYAGMRQGLTVHLNVSHRGQAPLCGATAQSGEGPARTGYTGLISGVTCKRCLKSIELRLKKLHPE